MNIGQWFLKDNKSEIFQNKTKAHEHNCHTLVLISIKFKFLFHVIINHDTVLRCITFVLERIYHIVRFRTIQSQQGAPRYRYQHLVSEVRTKKKHHFGRSTQCFVFIKNYFMLPFSIPISNKLKIIQFFVQCCYLRQKKKKTYVNISWDSTHSLVIFNDTKRTFGRCYRCEKLMQHRSC